MSILRVPVARAFQPLLLPARYKGAHGGRGSGKSHFFAERLPIEAIAKRGLRAVCIREVQKSLKESAKRLIEDKLNALNIGPEFDVQAAEIRTPGGGVILFQGMQDHTAESIKSLEGMDVAWVEEGQTLSDRSWRMLRPTIRKEGSEIWCSWNPRLRTDPIDKFYRTGGEGIACVQANWRDNPWFPSVLEEERKRDFVNDPDGYGHTWEGDYVTVMAGAYFAKVLREAKEHGRICRVSPDPLLPIWSFHDIGGAGAKADAYAIWIVQFVGREIRVLDYYEARGQVLAEHAAWLRQKWPKAKVRLPHDGANTNNVTGKRYQDHWQDAGFDASTRENAGTGAAAQRIEAVRRLFPQMWFNEATTDAGRAALGWYHARIDEERGTDLGPEHDWASHAADAFGLMALEYEEPRKNVDRLQMPSFGAV